MMVLGRWRKVEGADVDEESEEGRSEEFFTPALLREMREQGVRKRLRIEEYVLGGR